MMAANPTITTTSIIPAVPESNEHEEEEKEDQFDSYYSSFPTTPADDDSSSASSVSSTGTVIPSPGRALFARPQGVANRSSLDPIPWTTYFERELFLPSPDNDSITHHVYLTSPVPSASASSSKSPLFVLHHGAGSSGLSFCLLTQEIRKRLPTAGVLSLDARGHGSTSSVSQDLSLPTLTSDLLSVILLTQQKMSWPELPPLILVGHSLGGAVVTELACSNLLLQPGNLLGYAVLDVVEGSAMDALKSMQNYLATRPTGFVSLKDGIEWHVRSRTLRNSVSARASVPALLVDDKTTDSRKPWRWRTDLGATQPFWEGWFVGLSKKFLGGRGGKLLLLAGTDRLDTELTIGQMQGMFFFFFGFSLSYLSPPLPAIFYIPGLLTEETHRQICTSGLP